MFWTENGQKHRLLIQAVSRAILCADTNFVPECGANASYLAIPKLGTQTLTVSTDVTRKKALKIADHEEIATTTPLVQMETTEGQLLMGHSWVMGVYQLVLLYLHTYIVMFDIHQAVFKRTKESIRNLSRAVSHSQPKFFESVDIERRHRYVRKVDPHLCREKTAPAGIRSRVCC